MYNKNMFEKNIEKLSNIKLKERLKSIPITDCTNDIAFVQTLNGNIVFLKGEIPTEDTIDPIGYAKSLVTSDMKNFSNNDIIASVGFGVGYIIDELYNSTKAKIVIYEPDSKYLRFIFETVDLTQFLSDKRVFISDNMDDCIDFIINNYLNDDKLEFAISRVLSIFYKDDIESFTANLYSKLKNKIVDINTIKTLSKIWVNNVINFINLDKKFYTLEDFKWKYGDKNALILGAGPSLKDNIESIKNNRNKFVIFAVNKALKILEENDIIPDFAVFADARYVKQTYNISEEFTSKLNIIVDWKAEAAISEFKSNSTIVYFSDNELFIKKYAPELKLQLHPAEQTTTIIALMSANYMDFEKIYLCGVDLAFKENQPYCNDNKIEIQNSATIIDKAQKHIIEVPSITGGMVQTREDYSVFIKSFEAIIKTKGLKNLYNITDFGAYIEGMNYTTFDNINIYGSKPDVNEYIKSIEPANINLKSCLDKEKEILININNNILGHSPINLILKKIIENSALLNEYLQLELMEYTRNADSPEAKDEFLSKCILAIDKLLAIIY